MDLEDEIELEKEKSDEWVEILITGIDNYCKEYDKIKQKTLEFIKILEKNGIEVDSYSIKKTGGIKI